MSDFSFYFKIGWEHIITIDALDHILFIAALAAIYILKDWKQVAILVTAFTIGHTITLILSTKQVVTIDEGLVELLIPCTIIVTAISNLFQKSFTTKTVRINYFLALIFGLIHGLAFANTLRMLLATDQSFALAMFSFSVGLELGQILIVFLILFLSQLLIGVVKIDRKHWVIFLSAVVLGLALEMVVDRLTPTLSPRSRSANTQPSLCDETTASSIVLRSSRPPGPLMVAAPSPIGQGFSTADGKRIVERVVGPASRICVRDRSGNHFLCASTGSA